MASRPASLDAIDLVDRMIAIEGIHCDFHRSGAVELGYTDRDRNAFAKESAWMSKELGFETRLVSGSEMASVVGSERCAAALVDDFSGGSGQVHLRPCRVCGTRRHRPRGARGGAGHHP